MELNITDYLSHKYNTSTTKLLSKTPCLYTPPLPDLLLFWHCIYLHVSWKDEHFPSFFPPLPKRSSLQILSSLMMSTIFRGHSLSTLTWPSSSLTYTTVRASQPVCCPGLFPPQYSLHTLDAGVVLLKHEPKHEIRIPMCYEWKVLPKFHFLSPFCFLDQIQIPKPSLLKGPLYCGHQTDVSASTPHPFHSFSSPCHSLTTPHSKATILRSVPSA